MAMNRDTMNSMQITQRYIILSFLVVMSACVQAAPFVTTFVNTSSININLELHFSDHNISKKGIAMSQSYQVVNFDDKIVKSVIFSSLDKDKNGNLYGQLDKEFQTPKADVTYNLALQDVPSHTVAAAHGTDAFEMPASQVIICTVAPAGVKDSKPAVAPIDTSIKK